MASMLRLVLQCTELEQGTSQQVGVASVVTIITAIDVGFFVVVLSTGVLRLYSAIMSCLSV